jgi:hypothetical protein
VLSPEKICVPKEDPYVDASPNPCNNISSCIIPELKSSNSHFKIKVILKGQNRSASVAAMVDCGATALFINEAFVKKNRIRTYLLNREIPLYNIDGSKNRAGKITRFVRLRLLIGDLERWREFLVTDLGPEDVVLGLPWLRSVNPEIDWAEGTMTVDSEGIKGTGIQVEQVTANRVQR